MSLVSTSLGNDGFWAYAAEGNQTTASGLEAIGKGGLLELINQYFLEFMIIFIGILLLILIPIIVKYLAKKPSKLDIKLAELEREREKLQLLSKRMLIDNLKESAIIPTDREREVLDNIKIDSSILTRKISFQMNEIDARTKRLELGTDTAKLFETLTEVKNHEQKLYGKSL